MHRVQSTRLAQFRVSGFGLRVWALVLGPGSKALISMFKVLAAGLCGHGRLPSLERVAQPGGALGGNPDDRSMCEGS